MSVFTDRIIEGKGQELRETIVVTRVDGGWLVGPSYFCGAPRICKSPHEVLLAVREWLGVAERGEETRGT